jgi:hypothetical protein
MTRTAGFRWFGILTLAALAGVVADAAPAAQGKAEDDIKAAFKDLQGALKAKDAGKIWNLIDSDTQADAEKDAKKVKAAYKKADDKGKTELETLLGLTADEFTKLDGKLLLKTKRFLGKYDEIIDSKITGVTVQGESATVDYLEADGDKVKAQYTKQGGAWKVALPMPKFTK